MSEGATEQGKGPSILVHGAPFMCHVARVHHWCQCYRFTPLQTVQHSQTPHPPVLNYMVVQHTTGSYVVN